MAVFSALCTILFFLACFLSLLLAIILLWIIKLASSGKKKVKKEKSDHLEVESGEVIDTEYTELGEP